MNYFDNQGRVALLGCTSGGAKTDMGSGVGRGTIRARYAVEGAHDAANFRRLNGFRSEIDGLAYWLGFSAHKTTVTVQRLYRAGDLAEWLEASCSAR